MSRWQFSPLRKNHYGVIYADPAWRFVTRTPAGALKSPDRHYRTMTIDEISALPVGTLAARHAALALWIYDPLIPEIVRIVDTWGFRFVTRLFDWPKETANGRDAYGQGYFTRHGGEQCWLAVRGNPKCRDRSIRQYQRFKLREHSRKPDEFRLLLERLFDGPYCELFSRTDREGWDCWGDEAGKFGKHR